MSSPSPDVTAFLARIVETPDDPLPRLVFADWLDDTGGPAKAAWAEYIRLRAAQRGGLAGPTARGLHLRAHELIGPIGCPLQLRAAFFLDHMGPLLEVLPTECVRLDLTGFEPPAELAGLVSESVARCCRVIPMAVEGERLVVSTLSPDKDEIVWLISSYTGRRVVTAGVVEGTIGPVIDNLYRSPEEEIDPTLTVSAISVFEDVEFIPPVPVPDMEGPTDRLVRLVIGEAIRGSATAIDIEPGAVSAKVQQHVGGRWVERDGIPRQILNSFAESVHRLAGRGLFSPVQPSFAIIPFPSANGDHQLRLFLAPSSGDGPAIHIAIPAPNPPG